MKIRSRNSARSKLVSAGKVENLTHGPVTFPREDHGFKDDKISDGSKLESLR